MPLMRENEVIQAAIDATQKVRELNRSLSEALIARQKAIAAAFNDGYTQRTIADECDLSIKTVQSELKAQGAKRGN